MAAVWGPEETRATKHAQDRAEHGPDAGDEVGDRHPEPQRRRERHTQQFQDRERQGPGDDREDEVARDIAADPG
jgi:hypothetical protein